MLKQSKKSPKRYLEEVKKAFVNNIMYNSYNMAEISSKSSSNFQQFPVKKIEVNQE